MKKGRVIVRELLLSSMLKEGGVADILRFVGSIIRLDKPSGSSLRSKESLVNKLKLMRLRGSEERSIALVL